MNCEIQNERKVYKLYKVSKLYNTEIIFWIPQCVSLIHKPYKVRNFIFT